AWRRRKRKLLARRSLLLGFEEAFIIFLDDGGTIERQIALDAGEQLGQCLLLFLVEPLQGLLLRLLDGLLDRLDGRASLIGEENVGLPRIDLGRALVDIALALQPVDGLG